MQEKLKSWLRNDQVFYGLLLILVGFGSFALGRLSVLPSAIKPSPRVDFVASTHRTVMEKDSTGPAVDQPIESQNSSQSSNLDLSVVASKSGTKYHLPTCAGAKQIKSENLITFSGKEEAERAGYTPAANCPGLK